MKKEILSVKGMSCSHCVLTIQTCVSELSGIHNVLVSLKNETVEIVFDSTKISLDKIKKTIEECGYDIA